MDYEQRIGRPTGEQEPGTSFASHTSNNLGTFFETSTASVTNQKDNRTPRGRRTWLWLTLIVVVLVVAFIAWRSRQGSSAGAPKAGGGSGRTGPAAITVGKSTPGNMNIYVDALGTVTPTNTVTIYSQITGRVMDVRYREGQMVHKGDPLI
jgi:multidrug efflux system membrane fusion protein